MKDSQNNQPNAESGVEADRHIGGAAKAAQEKAGSGATVSKDGLTPDSSKSGTPKDGGAKS